jgi:hypothetical protein
MDSQSSGNGPETVVTFRVPVALRDSFRAKAEGQDRSLSAQLRTLMREDLDESPAVDSVSNPGARVLTDQH